MAATAAAALVREVPPDLADAELTFVDRRPIDVEVARHQHAGYVACLVDLGLDVVRLPPAPGHPDGVFVEDTLVVVDDLAVLTRPGAASRRGEVASVRAAVAARGQVIAAITAPATLDGGDVLQVGDTLYVGRSTRTNVAGIEQLAAIARTRDRRVVPIDVVGALHLKTAGANVVVVGDVVVVSAAAHRTAARVREHGFDVQDVDIGEFEKAEAGPSCLSVLLPAMSAR